MTATAEAPAFALDFNEARQPASDAARAVWDAAVFAAMNQKGMGIKDYAVGRSDTFFLSPVDIHVEEGWNSRDFSTPENQEHVRTLARSIAARGVERPLVGYMKDGRFTLTDGESRIRAVWRAINELGAEIYKVPVQTEPRDSTEPFRLIGQITRNGGKPLTPLETARLIGRAVDAGVALEEIARQTGYTLTRIRQLQELLTLPEPVQEQVASGVVSATLAAEVVRTHGEGAADAIQQAASANGGAKAGRATRKALEGVSGGSRQDAKVSAGPPPNEPGWRREDESENDLSSDLEKALQENTALREQIEQLSASDSGRTITGLQAQNVALQANVQRLLTEKNELKRISDSHSKLLEKIRSVLSVELNADIVGAIHDLKP